MSVKEFSEIIKFDYFRPYAGVGVFFSGQKALKFPKVPDPAPTREIPPERLPKAKRASLASGNQLTKGDYVRLVYFAFLGEGDILTVSFQTPYIDNNTARDWAFEKIKKLNALNMDAGEIIKFYNRDSEKRSRGLDQEFSRSSLTFFYICNRHMEFTKEKFSCVAMPGNPSPQKNPFQIIASTDSNFFALYNLFEPGSSTGQRYAYKFNLHMKTKGYPGDTPKIIPFLVDPEVKNDGPPR